VPLSRQVQNKTFFLGFIANFFLTSKRKAKQYKKDERKKETKKERNKQTNNQFFFNIKLSNKSHPDPSQGPY
jgi:hypothetical protein